MYDQASVDSIARWQNFKIVSLRLEPILNLPRDRWMRGNDGAPASWLLGQSMATTYSWADNWSSRMGRSSAAPDSSRRGRYRFALY